MGVPKHMHMHEEKKTKQCHMERTWERGGRREGSEARLGRAGEGGEP